MKEPETNNNSNSTTSTTGKKRMVYSIIVAVCALLLIVATVLTVYFVTRGNREVIENPPIDSGDPPEGDNPAGPGTQEPGDDQPAGPGTQEPDEGNQPAGPGTQEPDDGNDPSEGDQPSGGEKVAFVKPVESEVCSVEYNVVYNNTSLDRWYKHKGMDFVAEVGAPVFAMADGVVKEISLESVLGNYIILEHADGITSLYRFVEPIEGLKEGDEVKQGQTIATVAEAYGTEYKDGVHLHLEMKKEGENVDPKDYIDFTFEEK